MRSTTVVSFTASTRNGPLATETSLCFLFLGQYNSFRADTKYPDSMVSFKGQRDCKILPHIFFRPSQSPILSDSLVYQVIVAFYEGNEEPW